MSELLRLAAALRRSSDDELRQLLRERMINSAPLRDFFDLAEALGKPTSIASTVAGLPKSQVEALEKIIAGQTPDSAAAKELSNLMLVELLPGGEHKAYESTVEAFAQFNRTLEPAAVFEVSSSVQSDIDRDAGVATFETMQALTELLFDLEQRFVREVGKRNVGLPDLKRLANHLKKPNDYAREVYDLAHLSGLIVLAESRWQLGQTAIDWVSWNPQQRFSHLNKSWREILGDASANELLSSLSKHTGPVSLDRELKLTYPFADGAVNSRISKLANLAELIGISANGWFSSWAKDVLTGAIDKATETAQTRLPATQRKLICQADLSLVAPGPLPTDIEIELRKFTETEQIGMASTYRLSALSISHGLETGLSEQDIRTLLLELSGKPLPQPIDYLLREGAQRFGRLTVSNNGELLRSVVRSIDQILLQEIFNQSKLKPFALRQLEDGSLASRFEPEVVYFGLRELGFTAIRVDEKGEVISPRIIATISRAGKSLSTVDQDIERMREQETKLGDAPDGDDVLRQIHLAIKNKTKIEITVETRSGSEVVFTLEPIGIANGRLRAKDRKADIERTLPLTSILKVTLE